MIIFSGSSTQTVKLPDATTIPAGSFYVIRNDSSGGAVTVQDGAASTKIVLEIGGATKAVLVTAGTQGGTWNFDGIGFFTDPIDLTKKQIWKTSGATTATTLTVAETQSTSQTLSIPNLTGAGIVITDILAQSITGQKTFTAPILGAATGTSLAVTGAVTSSGGGIGYAAGSGGAVTQLTSKVTAFTLSKYSGTIQFAADALGADTSSAGAAWTNTVLAATDHVVFTHVSGGTLGAYNVACLPAAGSATIYIRNLTPGSLSEAPVFKFSVIKGVIT